MNPKPPPVIGVPWGCCGHASGISLPPPPWLAGCALYATPCSVLGHSCYTMCCRTSYIAAIFSSFFILFEGCFRLSWLNRNKKYNPQQTKNVPRDEQTSYVLYYSRKASGRQSRGHTPRKYFYVVPLRTLFSPNGNKYKMFLRLPCVKHYGTRLIQIKTGLVLTPCGYEMART